MFTMLRNCIRCKQEIPAGRLEVLPNTHTCVTCSTEQQYRGAMVFDHKTAPRLVYVRPENKESLEQLKRFVNRARR
jgi:2'-5' RNA ligase